MRYTKFRIENYRAISGTLEISLNRNSLIPVIGVNESGKSTILQALLAFDFYNDLLNENGRHLKDIQNLYSTAARRAVVSAEIELSREEFVEALDSVVQWDNPADDDQRETARVAAGYRRKLKGFSGRIWISRDLISKKYTLGDADIFPDSKFNHALARAIISSLPYILYFDDFRDSIAERIQIESDSNGKATGWLAIIEQLFKQTDESFSVFALASLEDRKRKSVLSKVNRKLNETLTKEWQNFKLDESGADALEIEISFEEGGDPKSPGAPTLKLEIVETTDDGEKYYFYIRDRSKGFFWFFNFVMKLEFNPKIVEDSENLKAIYLLDEPGSYLHASAQSRLCAKLRQLSKDNCVIYCTHSHYLLNPDFIAINSIRIANKDGRGEVQLVPIHEYRAMSQSRRTAIQPVIDALEIKPFLLDLNPERIVVAEGIADYYALELFKENRQFSVLPSVNADSVADYCSLLIAWGIDFRALWDNDKEGKDAFERASEAYGPGITRKSLRLLPLKGQRARKRIMQDLFAGEDLIMIRDEVGLSKNSKFSHTIEELFYHHRRDEIVGRVSAQTKENFSELFSLLGV